MTIGDGALVTIDQARALAIPDIRQNGFLVALRDDVEPEHAVTTFVTRWGNAVEPPVTPDDVTNLVRVHEIPDTLAVIVGALSLAAMGLVLASTVRERDQEFLTLGALGATRLQLRGVIVVQALVLWAASLLAGLPLGLVIGRFAWRTTANGLGTLAQPQIPVAAIAMLAITGCAGVLATAVIPARRVNQLVTSNLPTAHGPRPNA